MNHFNLSLESNKFVFGFDVRKLIDEVANLSYGTESAGISGNVNLNVTGDFSLAFSAALINGNDGFDLELLGDNGIEFNANVDVLCDKLTPFNLGMNTNVGALLANLISIGADDGDSFIKLKSSFNGSYGKNGISIVDWKDENGGNIPFSYSLPVQMYGVLPISVLGREIGNVYLGVWDGSANHVLGYNQNLNAITTAFTNNTIAGKNIVDGFDFNLITNRQVLPFEQGVDTHFVVDFSEVFQFLEDFQNGNLDWFEKIKLAVVGLDELFDRLEASLNSNLASKVKDAPIIGNALGSGFDFLGNLKNKVIEPFSDFVYESTGLNAELVADKLKELFGTPLTLDTSLKSKLLSGRSDSWSDNGFLMYRSSDNYAEWFLHLSGSYELGNNLGFDFGLPGLALDLEGGLNLDLSWNLNFGFGIDDTQGFYLILTDADELWLDATANVDATVNGSLAGLGIGLEFNGNAPLADVFLGLDLGGSVHSDGQNNTITAGSAVALSNVLSSQIDFDFVTGIDLNPTFTFGIAGYDVFPKITGTFDFEWDSAKGLTKLGFSGMELDLGSFVGNVLSPMLSRIQNVIAPMKELLDFLTTPFPVLDDLGFSLTPLQLAKEASNGSFDDGMIVAAQQIMDLIDSLSNFDSSDGRLKYRIDDFNLYDSDGIEDKYDSALAFLCGSLSGENLTVGDYQEKNPENNDSAEDILSNVGLNFGNEWAFLWSKPSNIFKMLLGQDVPLIEYYMPPLNIEFNWNTFVPIYGPLGARISITFDAKAELGFGYDTLGIRQWARSNYKDYGLLMNGFYINDRNSNGVDINELSFKGKLSAAAEVNAGVRAGVGGGVTINIGFNLYDPNKDGKIRVNEIAQIVKEEGLIGVFDTNGSLTFGLEAYVGFLCWTWEKEITKQYTLFEFEINHSGKTIWASEDGSGNVVAHVGENASSRIVGNLEDGDEVLELYFNETNVYDEPDGKHFGEVKNGVFIANSKQGNDKIVLTGRADFDIEINGGDGDDYIDLSGLQMLNNHSVFIWGGAGNDTIIGADGLNIIFGDIGTVRKDDDKYIIEANVDPGVAGNDIILGGSKKDIIFGGAGNDQIDGGASSDYIFGDGGRYDETGTIPKIDRTDINIDGGRDTLIGGDGNDAIYGGGGDDHIDGGAGNDEIYGERGHDRIMGGSDDDTIHGGEGMDVVFGDRITDGSKDVANPFAVDTTNKTAAFSQEFIDAQFKNGTSASEDEFKIKLVDELNNPVKYAQEIKTAINDDNNDDFADYSSDLKTNGSDTIYGDDGNDLIFGDDGGDTAVGGADKIYGGIGNDIIDGDGGADTIVASITT